MRIRKNICFGFVALLAFITFYSVDLKAQDRAGWISIDDRLTYGDISSELKLKRNISLSGWKGEELYAQAVICTSDDLDSLEVIAGNLRNRKYMVPSSSVKAGFVGYVMTDELNKDKRGACGARINSEFDSSFVADPINYDTGFKKLDKNTIQPVWVKINIPSDAAPGKYSGNISFIGKDKVIAVLPFDLTVSSWLLPEKNDFHLDLWQNPYSVARYYGVVPFSEEHFDLMRPIMKEYADAGGKVITASIIHKPWNAQTYDPFESMVTWLKKADGTWLFDYTVFDKWVEFMMSLGVEKQINCYSMVPWALSFQYIDQATNSFRFLDAEPGTPEYEQFWGTMLRSFAAHLKEKGWFDITMIAMDERPMHHMKAAIEVIKNADSDFRISFAGNCHEELLDIVDDYCIPIGTGYPEGSVQRRRNSGKVTTVYTSCAEAWPNTFTFSSPAEAEWIGWAAAAQGVDGYLRWALNSWTESPFDDSRFRTWAAGDTYLLYPDAVTSIRFERLKSGITAFRKVAVLRDYFTKTGNKKKLAELDKMLSLFVVPDTDGIVRIVSDESEDYASKTVNIAKQFVDMLSLSYHN